MFTVGKLVGVLYLAVAAYGAASTTVCGGCGAESGAGLAIPAHPNNPLADGASNPPPAGSPTGTPPTPGTTNLLASNITTPGTAAGSWSLAVTGNGSQFISVSGECEVKPDTPEGEDPCKEKKSCEWKLKPGQTGSTSLTITVTAQNPAVAGTTNPAVSGNWTPNQTANPPEYSATFSSDDPPMKPGCGSEIRYVLCWNLAGGPQRWELSFRCAPCATGSGGDDGEGGGG